MQIHTYNQITSTIIPRDPQKNEAAKKIQKYFRNHKKLISEKVNDLTFESSELAVWQRNYVTLKSRKVGTEATWYYFPEIGLSFREPKDTLISNDYAKLTNGCDKFIYKKDDNFILLGYKKIDQFQSDWQESKLTIMLSLNKKLVDHKTLYFSYPLNPNDTQKFPLVIAKNAGPSLYELHHDEDYFKTHTQIRPEEFKTAIDDLTAAENAGLMFTDLHHKNITRKQLIDGSYRINIIDIDYITQDENLRLNAPQDIYPFDIATRYRRSDYVQHNYEQSLKVIRNSYKFMMLINIALATRSHCNPSEYKANWVEFRKKTECCSQNQTSGKADYLEMLERFVVPELGKWIKADYLSEVIEFIKDPEYKTLSVPFNELFSFSKKSP